MAAAGEQSACRLRPGRTGSQLAQLAEDAKFDSLFLADGPALTGSGEFRPPGQLEPLTLLTALSQHTSRIGLIATVSSTYNEPYNLARRLASVDHVSGGRAGWNIVTSATPEEAANFGIDNRLDHSSRYARADEFLDVAKALWDSWETEAVLGDKSSGRYADLSRLHAIDHRGDHFKVAGPLNVERPPQGHPLLVQAGSSEDGKSFAARHAEAIFTAHQTYERAADFYGDIKARTKAAGRDPDGVLVLPGIVPIIGSTEREARELARQLDELRVPEYGLWQLANILETDTSAFELDKPLPDFVLARPKLEGAQSRADLIIELAQRRKPHRSRDPVATGRRTRSLHFHRYTGSGRRHDRRLVRGWGRGRVQHHGRGAALRTGDLHRPRTAHPATQGTVPGGLHGCDAA